MSDAARRPVVFSEPTSIDVEQSGTLLLVENNPGRILRVDPASGRVTVVAPSISRPYAIVATAAGRVVFSASNSLFRLAAGKPPVRLARAGGDIGPVAVARNGTVYFATGTHVYQLPPGATAPVALARTATFSSPHGLAVARDGSVLVSDTGNNRIVRLVRGSRAVTVLAHVRGPRGLDVSADGTVYVVDSGANRVLQLAASGASIGYLPRTTGDLYDVRSGPNGVVYVLEAGAVGIVRAISRNGAVTTVSGRADHKLTR